MIGINDLEELIAHMNVESFLIESRIRALMHTTNYSSKEIMLTVLQKLVTLKQLLVNNNVQTDHEHMVTVVTCIDAVTEGNSLSVELIKQLNDIHNCYA